MVEAEGVADMGIAVADMVAAWDTADTAGTGSAVDGTRL